ncbi:DUF4190 domain-containing protein [Sphaerisporangium sp. B11E5]|uniref:DUF4190 domain-containing protein n=1 Tax=Sphaerisporangium sp. B11E5 TaxID=3153563 RepID=UPI00325C79C2
MTTPGDPHDPHSRPAGPPSSGESPGGQGQQPPPYGQPYGGTTPPSYGEPPYYGGPPPYGQYPPGGQPSGGLGTASLVLGILSIVLLLVCGIGLLTAIAGLIVGFIALARRSNKGRAIVGLVLSGLTLLLGVLAFVWFLNTFQECLDAPTQAEAQSCVERKLGVQQPVGP